MVKIDNNYMKEIDKLVGRVEVTRPFLHDIIDNICDAVIVTGDVMPIITFIQVIKSYSMYYGDYADGTLAEKIDVGI